MNTCLSKKNVFVCALLVGFITQAFTMKRKKQEGKYFTKIKKHKVTSKSLAHLSQDSLRNILSFLMMKDIAHTSLACKKLQKSAVVHHLIALKDFNLESLARCGNCYFVRMLLENMNKDNKTYTTKLKWASYWALVNNHPKILELISLYLDKK